MVEFLSLSLGLLVLLLIAFGISGWAVYRTPWDADDRRKYEQDEKVVEEKLLYRSLLFISLVGVAMCVIANFYDAWTLKMNVNSAYMDNNYYAWPRLFIIAGYLIIGFFGDIRKRMLVPVLSLCISMLAILNPILLQNASAYEVNMCLFYIFLGARNAYLYLMFWDAAPRTKHPEWWASAGRVIICIVDVFLSVCHLSDAPMYVMVSVDIVMLCAMIILMMANGDLSFERSVPARVLETPMDLSKRREAFAERYRLTPREREVLEKLITTEDGTNPAKLQDFLFVCQSLNQDRQLSRWP